MNYIYKDRHGVTQLTQYFEYLKSIQDKLPNDVYKFASDIVHYSFEDYSSLHDAWLDQCSIKEVDKDEHFEQRHIVIDLKFLGAFHDRMISLSYIDVINYSIIMPEDNMLCKGHGDLLIHEIRLSNRDNIIHELIFSTNSIFLIECKNININEELLKNRV
jgi:hypothetical protein